MHQGNNSYTFFKILQTLYFVKLKKRIKRNKPFLKSCELLIRNKPKHKLPFQQYPFKSFFNLKEYYGNILTNLRYFLYNFLYFDNFLSF